MLAKIIQFPVVNQDKLCSECTNGYVGDDGVYCRTFSQMINNEREAEECESYQP